jgi:hypothetical protein
MVGVAREFLQVWILELAELELERRIGNLEVGNALEGGDAAIGVERWDGAEIEAVMWFGAGSVAGRAENEEGFVVLAAARDELLLVFSLALAGL